MIIDNYEHKTLDAEYTFAEIKEFFKPSEGELLQDGDLIIQWNISTDIHSLKQYLKNSGQNRYRIVETS